MADGAAAAQPADHAGRAADDAPGRALLQALYAASRLNAMWGAESRLTEEAMQALSAAIRGAAADGRECVLRFVNDMAYLGDQRLRVDFSGFGAFRHVQERVTRHGIGEISFTPAATRQELTAFLRVIEGKPDPGTSPDAAFDAARAALLAAGAGGVGIGPVVESDGGRGRLGPTDARQAAMVAYFRAVFVARRTEAAVREGRAVAVRRTKRAVHELLDVLERDPPFALALAQVRNYHGFAATHAANVCVLACAAALRSGMAKLAAADVGVAALLHEPLVLDPSRTHAPAMRERDRAAAQLLLASLGFSDGALRAVLAVRDLHAEPAADATPRPLVAEILRAACFLDTATTPAGADWPPEPAPAALDMMARDPRRFDPAVVQIFRDLLGVHPPGTVVRLDTGEVGLVRTPPGPGADPALPAVGLFADADGRPLDEPVEVDLAAQDGANPRSIAEASQPATVFRTPAEYVRLL